MASISSGRGETHRPNQFRLSSQCLPIQNLQWPHHQNLFKMPRAGFDTEMFESGLASVHGVVFSAIGAALDSHFHLDHLDQSGSLIFHIRYSVTFEPKSAWKYRDSLN